MTSFLRPLGVNSILIVISTALLSLLIHEFAHYLVYVYFGLAPEMHHNYVHANVSGSPLQLVIAAGTGPLTSLFAGVLCIYIANNLLKPSLQKLFVLWLGLGNSIIFLGYILIAPFIAKGDTGLVYAYLGIPKAIGIAISIGLVFIIRKIFGKISHQFYDYKSEEIFNQVDCSKQMILYPIVSSILLVTLLNFPMVVWVSALPTIFTPMAYLSIYKQYLRDSIVEPSVYISKISTPLIIITAMVVTLFRYLV